MVYVDNAASTQVRPEVLAAMDECAEFYGNPSAIHEMGQKSKALINNARKQISKSISAQPNEIIFTSSGTESNNIALQGFINANANMGVHIITTDVEHASVRNPINYLYDMGCEITYLPVNSDGLIDVQRLRCSIRKNTILISIIFANNEIGTIQPIREIGEISKKYNICFHTDAVQAFGHCNIDVDALGIDMMSISGHKIYAPKGVGALYVRDGIKLYPIIYGGGQEYGLRSGTENVNAIVGMGKAAEMLDETAKIKSADKFSRLKEKLIDGIMARVPNVKLNGSTRGSLDSIVNMSFEGIKSEPLLTMLSENGIYASNGAACASGKLRPSHVLKAIGVPDNFIDGSVRFSFGIYNIESEVSHILEVLPGLVDKLRRDAL